MSRAAVVDEPVLLARAYLNTVAEPASPAVWSLVREVGPVAAAARIRGRDRLAPGVAGATEARYALVEPATVLARAAEVGARLVVPESPEWPHFGLAALEHAGVRRLVTLDAEPHKYREVGEPVPPLALWVRGPGDLAALGTRSVSIVGSRAATSYGTAVARRLASELAGCGVTVVSGGALGIDREAHLGALAVRGDTVLVSPGGLDITYPTGHDRLFGAVADRGLLVSEHPPGTPPARHRFLKRNRLIAALGAGTVVVEAGRRSGTANTLNHARRIGRPIMAVPGSIESALSVGCHDALRDAQAPAVLVTGAGDVLEVIGAGSSPGVVSQPPGEGAGRPPAGRDSRSSGTRRARAERRRRALDTVDERSRCVFDGFPADRAVHPDELVVASGLTAREVLVALPQLEVAGLVEQVPDGYRITG
ncbi:DNA-processing protein DprA [Jatrophihabitans fulvus]